MATEIRVVSMNEYCSRRNECKDLASFVEESGKGFYVEQRMYYTYPPEPMNDEEVESNEVLALPLIPLVRKKPNIYVRLYKFLVERYQKDPWGLRDGERVGDQSDPIPIPIPIPIPYSLLSPSERRGYNLKGNIRKDR